MKLKVLNLNNEEVGSVELDPAIYGKPYRGDILHRVVEWQRSKSRAGTHKTKGVSEIAGTTKKPYKQKGTGHARQGSLRSPQYRGGATIFGPVVRSHEYDLPKKVRKLGLKTALSAKLAAGKLRIIEQASLDEAKTSKLSKIIAGWNVSSALIIDGTELNSNFVKALANINKFNMLPTIGANVYDILRHDELILTRQAVEQLAERLK
jgi:large subunit ribosomal protein L4